MQSEQGETVERQTREVMGHVGRIQIWDFIPVPFQPRAVVRWGESCFFVFLRTVLAPEGKGESETRVEVEAQ